MLNVVQVSTLSCSVQNDHTACKMFNTHKDLDDDYRVERQTV